MCQKGKDMNNKIVPMNILETKIMSYNACEYTLRLAQQKNDKTRYAFILQNNVTGNSAKYEFIEENSLNFSQYNDEALFEHLPKQIQLDLKKDSI